LSGIVSVALYGLGMGLFVTALTVSLAFAKGALVRSGRSVMKVVSSVSSVLVLVTGVYLTWYWYVAITQRTNPGSLIEVVGRWQTYFTTMLSDLGAVPIAVGVCIFLIASYSFSGKRRQQMSWQRARSDVIIGLVVGLAVAAILAVDDQFLISSDLKMYLLGFERWRDNGQFFPGATGDFARSLGVSEYPGGLLFNVPWLIATAVPDSMTIIAYCTVISLSLYAVVIALGRRLSVPPVARQIAGFMMPLALLLPGPLMLNSVGRYDPSFLWGIVTVAATLLTVSCAHRLNVYSLIGLNFSAGMFVFWSNVQFYPVVLPIVLLGCVVMIWRTRHSPILGQVTAASALCLTPALLSGQLFLGTYLFSVWRIPDQAVAENIDSPMSLLRLRSYLLPFPGLESFMPGINAATSHVLRTATLVGILFASSVCYRQGKRHLANTSILGVVLQASYSAIYYLSIRFFTLEIGLDPSYVQVFAYPIWILLLVTATLSGLSNLHLERLLNSPLVPFAIIMLWVGQWGIRNFDTRHSETQYPIQVSKTSQILHSLTEADRQSGHLTRAIIIQSQFPEQRRVEGFRIRRSSDFSETLLMELTELRVPVLNAYTHMISPIAFSMTNQLFGDGRPSWRQFSLYDKPNIDAMPALGIKYILSEDPITDSRANLLHVEPFKINGTSPTGGTTYLYAVMDSMWAERSSVTYDLRGSTLRVVGSLDPDSSLLLPIEFSKCIQVRSNVPDSFPVISPSDRGFLQVDASGRIDFTLTYSNSMFKIPNCRVEDYLSFIEQQSSQP